MKEILSLAFEKLRRKKKNSIFLFLVLAISFGFLVLSLSLERSMSYTNQQFRFDNYGEWYFAIPNGLEKDAAWLQRQDWAQRVGRMETLGEVQTPAGAVGLGTLDEEMIRVGRLGLDAGRWPEAEHEIVMESDALMALGLSCTVGQELRLAVRVPDGEGWATLEQTYRLCGILREYSGLWALGLDAEQPLASAVVSEAGAARLEAAARQQGVSLAPALQYFVLVPRAGQQQAAEELDAWLSSAARNGAPALSRAYQNLTAYEQSWNGLDDGAYPRLVAAVAIAAVLCIYFMQLPQELRGFATLRSIGMSRGQLAGALAAEALLLCLPAVAVGGALGAAGTWAALRLLVETRAFQIRLAIPWARLLGAFALWGCGVVAARLLPFAVTLRMPLTGRAQLPRAQAARAKWLRRGGVLVLLALFGAAAALPCFETILPKRQMEDWTGRYSFRLRKVDLEALSAGTGRVVRKRAGRAGEGSAARLRRPAGQGLLAPYKVDEAALNARLAQASRERSLRENLGRASRSLSPELRRQIEQTPGVDRTVAVTQLEVGLAFDGMEEKTVCLLAVEEEPEWEEVLALGEDREAFYRGELVLLCFPASTFDLDTRQVAEVDLARCPLPEGEVELRLRADAGPGGGPGRLLARAAVRAEVRSGMWGHPLLPLSQTYTVVCSQAYLTRLAARLPEGCAWQLFEPGEAPGWSFLYVMCDPYTTGLSLDRAISELSEAAGLTVLNQRQKRAVLIQESLQMIVLLWAAGGCVALILLLILGCVFSLEAEQRRRERAILRAIGMSRRQLRGRLLRRAAGRGLAAVLGGGALYLVYDAIARRSSLFYLYGRALYWAGRLGPAHTALLAGACFALPLAVSLAATRQREG